MAIGCFDESAQAKSVTVDQWLTMQLIVYVSLYGGLG